jgi:hypothetical protein
MKRLVRGPARLRLLSRLLGVASYFQRLSSDNATMSAVFVTSRIAIDTYIAKSDDNLKKVRQNVMKRMTQN